MADSPILCFICQLNFQRFINYQRFFFIRYGATPSCNWRKSIAARFSEIDGCRCAVMTFAPFVDWGKFLPNPASNEGQRVKAELADGTVVNVNTFPVNHSEVIIYPKSDDAALNQEAFRTWQLIRLPQELGGDKNDASAFRAFSMVCLHLWCLWKYWRRKVGRGASAHVMEACMTPRLG